MLILVLSLDKFYIVVGIDNNKNKYLLHYISTKYGLQACTWKLPIYIVGCNLFWNMWLLLEVKIKCCSDL